MRVFVSRSHAALIYFRNALQCVRAVRSEPTTHRGTTFGRFSLAQNWKCSAGRKYELYYDGWPKLFLDFNLQYADNFANLVNGNA